MMTQWVIRGAVLGFIILALARVSPAQDSLPTTRQAVSDADFVAALNKAKGLLGTDLNHVLVPVASRFQMVEVCPSAGGNMWSFRMLNQRGKGFDAIRFKVPPGTHTHLYWAFAIPKTTEFYIAPLNGDAVGFKNFFTVEKGTYDVPGMINDKIVLQELPALQPGGEYLLWFKLDAAKPQLLAVSIVLLDDLTNEANLDDIARVIGLKQQ